MKILKIIALLISFLGYYLYAKRKNIKDEFIPILIISIISLAVYFGGILNFLVEVTILTCGVGLILFCKEIYLIIKNKEKIEFKNYNIIIFLLMMLWAIWLLKDTFLIHYDNFSHWANIVKEMLISGHLPNFTSTRIFFKAYPPGTACFIYYICKYCGNAESIMLIAQTSMILASSYTIFAFCNRKNKVNYIIGILFSIFAIISNVFFIDQLLVDIVLVVMGIAGLCIILYYKDDVKKGLYFSIPILSLLAIVKNSGIFFIIIDLIIYFIFFIKNNGFKRIFTSKYILLIFLPILVKMIFSAHVELVFGECGNVSLHAMTIENYVATMKEKEQDDYKIILDKLLLEIRKLSDISNRTLIIIFFTYIFMIIFTFRNKKTRNTLILLWIMSILSYFIYQVGLYFTYIFSMPRGEALALAAYDRYFKTLVAFEFGIFAISTITFLSSLEENKKIKKLVIECLVCILLVIPIYYNRSNLSKLYVKPDNQSTSRAVVLNYKEKYGIEEEKTYLIYVPEEYTKDNNYFAAMCEYDFRAKKLKLITDLSELKSANEVFEYDYLIILNKNEQIKSFLNQIERNVDLDVIKLK